jgi:hypothetical protein
LSQTLQEHQETTQIQHSESKDLVETQHKETRFQVFAVVNAAATSLDHQFQFMRREIEIVNNAVAKNRLETSRMHQEIKAIAQAISAARSGGQRKKLQQRSNLATEALYSLLSVLEKLTVSQNIGLHSAKPFSNRARQAILESLKARAAMLMASVGFALLWKAQEDAGTPFSFQRSESPTSTRPWTREEHEHVRQRRTAVLCSNYYYYYFPLCRRRDVVQKQSILADLKGIHPVDTDVQAQFPNLPLLLDLTAADWKPNFAWAVKDAIELPFLFHLPTPSVAYDFLSIALAFAAVMPQIADDACAESILADLFGNSTHLSSPPGSAQRQRIKNDYHDWQKIVALLWLDELFMSCHEQACVLWGVEKSTTRMVDCDPDGDEDPLVVKLWLWLMSGWQTCFSFQTSRDPRRDEQGTSDAGASDAESALVYSIAEFLVRSSYNISLKIEHDANSGNTFVKIYFLGARESLSVPAPAVVQQRRRGILPGEL